MNKISSALEHHAPSPGRERLISRSRPVQRPQAEFSTVNSIGKEVVERAVFVREDALPVPRLREAKQQLVGC